MNESNHRIEENQRVDDDAPKNNSINQIVKNKMGVDTNEMAKRKRNESNPMIQQHYTYHYFYYDLMPSITGGGDDDDSTPNRSDSNNCYGIVCLSYQIYTLRMWSRAESKFVLVEQWDSLLYPYSYYTVDSQISFCPDWLTTIGQDVLPFTSQWWLMYKILCYSIIINMIL